MKSRSKAKVKPSRSARCLFSQMAARSTNLVLNLEQTIVLIVDRQRAGHGLDQDEVHDLLEEGWIQRDDSSGGWRLGG